MNQDIDYERLPADQPMDETDVSLRAYLAGLDAEHLAAYDPRWSDDEVIAWDGNFRNDGALMLVCCERDVDVHEFRMVLEEHLRYRNDISPSNPLRGGGTGHRGAEPCDAESR